MGQVTARISDELEEALNRWATEDKVQRSDLIREVLTEAARARHEGRAMFARPELLEPVDLKWLAARLHEHDGELDRLFRQVAKRDTELARLTGADGRVVSEARTAIVDGVAERVRAATELVTREDERTREVVLAAGMALPEKIVAMIADLSVLAAIVASLARIEEFARQPRKDFHLHVGGQDLKLREALIWLAGISLILVVMLLCLVKGFSSVGNRVAAGLLSGGDTAVCRMVEYEHDARNCVVEQKGGTITATAKIRPMER